MTNEPLGLPRGSDVTILTGLAVSLTFGANAILLVFGNSADAATLAIGAASLFYYLGSRSAAAPAEDPLPLPALGGDEE